MEEQTGSERLGDWFTVMWRWLGPGLGQEWGFGILVLLSPQAPSMLAANVNT